MISQVKERVLRVIHAPDAARNVERYFTVAGAGTFTGRLFEQFGDGGDNPNIANRFAAEDLIAVESLSVSVPPDVAFEILHGVLASQLAGLLADIPTAVDLGTPEATPHLATGSPSRQAWELLDEQPGIGWVTAGKLLARKRPRLLPVYDRVVRCVLGRPTGVWLELHEALADGELRARIESLRPHTAAHVSTLRLLDVAIWMNHHDEHRNCAQPRSTNRE